MAYKRTTKKLTKKEKKARFLKHLSQTANIAGSARAIGITRQTAYNWKKADAKFAAEWDEAEQAHLDECVEVVFNEALGRLEDGPPNAEMAFRILARKRHKEWGQVDKNQDEVVVPVQILLGGNMAEGLK